MGNDDLVIKPKKPKGEDGYRVFRWKNNYNKRIDWTPPITD